MGTGHDHPAQVRIGRSAADVGHRSARIALKRYVLCPGPVTSKIDGDLHYITARQLAFLYQVPMNECYVDSGSMHWKTGKTQEHLDSLIWLFPDFHGRYKVPIR